MISFEGKQMRSDIAQRAVEAAGREPIEPVKEKAWS
jgi:hypothetical protein